MAHIKKLRTALFDQLQEACYDLDYVCDRADELISELLDVTGAFLSAEERDQLNAILAGLR